MTDSLHVGRITSGQIMADSIRTGAVCRLALPYSRPPASLWGNTRSHWRARSRDTAQVRADVVNVARAAGLHRLCDGRIEHVIAALTWAPGDRRVRDDDNLWPMAKVVFDAIARRRADLIGLDLVPDDSPEWMTKNAPRILPPPHEKGMWLDLTLRFRQGGSS